MNVLKRQGDILLEKIDSVVDTEVLNRVREDGVIALGETTGHAHKIEGGELVDTRQGMMVLAGEDTKVVHEEHDTLELEEGVWLVHRQTEYLSATETATVYD